MPGFSDKRRHRHILIISDIEGSSMCRGYNSTRFLNRSWPEACLGMTLDTNQVIRSLFNAGATSVQVKDFHRTGFNIFPDLLDHRSDLVSGYVRGPVPGIGDPGKATGLMLIGMHAPSGSGGFLPHTLTSRISRLEINGKLMSEAQLFSASLSHYGLTPIFFSGCPEACKQISGEISTLDCFPIHDEIRACPEKTTEWRNHLGQAAAAALSRSKHKPYVLNGPFHAKLTFRDGADAARIASLRWGVKQERNAIHIHSNTFSDLYLQLICTAYLNPLSLKMLAVGLPLYNLIGRIGLWLARWQIYTKKQHLQG